MEKLSGPFITEARSTGLKLGSLFPKSASREISGPGSPTPLSCLALLRIYARVFARRRNAGFQRKRWECAGVYGVFSLRESEALKWDAGVGESLSHFFLCFDLPPL